VSPLTRRALGALALATAAQPAGAGGHVRYPILRPGTPLAFPADHGAHPEHRTEWWYVTGWLRTSDGEDLGFQVTFFRTRPDVDPANPSAFAPRQVLFAHAALSDPRSGRLAHDQRVARAGFGLAQAKVGDADVVLDDWRFWREADGRFRTRVRGDGFALDLAFAPTQPPLLQGQAGFSRKGPMPEQASYYYSLPHLAVSGTLRRGRKAAAVVTGEAWMDREWSSSILGGGAVGWDWTGINLEGGAALMAFRVRDAKGQALWAGGALREAGRTRVFAPGDVAFSTLRRWRSPRTGALYPVEQALSVRLPQGERRWRIRPLFDDQELDSRTGGGPVYWEGATTVEGGRGYLELTGYVAPLKM